jgi:hypothetical protein
MSNDQKPELQSAVERPEPGDVRSSVVVASVAGKSDSGLSAALSPVASESAGWGMWLITGYLLLILAMLLYAVWSVFGGHLVIGELEELVKCCLFGGIGGCLYCLRAVYLNACVRRNWTMQWAPWYLIRPVVSCISGGAAFVFLKAGLLVLEAAADNQQSGLGFLALAFIAGLNVDKFIGKLEDIAQSVWGIEKSRASKGE